jgi:hypothetical protein
MVASVTATFSVRSLRAVEVKEPARGREEPIAQKVAAPEPSLFQ